MPDILKTLPQRITSKINRSDGCWLWTAGTSDKGYGVTSIGTKRWRVHRLIWTVVRGPIPAGTKVLHSCDTPPCCRPSHMFLGSDQDNSDDRVAKGRQARGEGNAGAKLSEHDVHQIRASEARGTTRMALSEIYGVGTTTIWNILHRKKWAYLETVDVPLPKIPAKRPAARRINRQLGVPRGDSTPPPSVI